MIRHSLKVILFSTILIVLSIPVFASTLQHHFPAGWNFVSVPIQPTNPIPTAVFDEAGAPLRIYDYMDGKTLTLGQAEFQNITAGRANWLLLKADTDVQVTGDLLNTSVEYRVPLSPGWNAVATPWPVAVAWNDTRIKIARGLSAATVSSAISQGWIEGELKSYETPTGQYTVINPNSGSLIPWRGYLLFSNFPAELIFNPLPPNTVPPTVNITSPADSTKVSALTQIIGTADDTDLTEWTLEFAPAQTQQFVTIATGDFPVVNGALGNLDPTLQINGIGLLRLSASDLFGNNAEITRTVFIEGDNKLGHFSISFVDLEVPVSGIPITVRRTYDSRERNIRRDFGFGWSIEVVARGRYINNRPPGEGWAFTGVIDPCTTVSATESHATEIRFSDREFYRFAIQMQPQSTTLGGCFATANFVQIGGIPGATLEDTNPNMANRLFWQTGTDEIIDTETSTLYEPQKVRLTTLDGRQFIVDLNNGLEQIKDLNNNVLTISNGGVTHNSGRSITFVRNGQGQITSITDPMNHSLTYFYDGAGDLTSVTDRDNHAVSFTYDNHFLTQIIDAENNTPLYAEYDAEGRVIRLLDADGNESLLNHNIVANSSTATDRLGNSTTYQYGSDGFLSDLVAPGNITTQYTYNPRGLVLTETNPLNQTTTYSYDSNDNLLTQTNALNQTTTYTYNSRGQILTITDPRNKVTENTYDTNGNLSSVKDPLNHVITYTYDDSGNVKTETDPMLCVTSYDYDAFGNLLKRTDGAGNVTDYSYDANGNRLTETVHRTVGGSQVAETTTYTYDNSNRLLTRKDPLNNTVVTTYDNNGRLKTQKDERGNTTAFDYDARGNLFKRTYADTTFEVYAYDLEGRRTGLTDRGGRNSFTEYDALGRIRKQIHADGKFITNTYDDASRLIAVTNERNYTTNYEYDAAGRRIKITDPLNHVTEFGYDANGNQISIRDANDNTTTFEYDDNNRQIKIIYPDSTFRSITYDSDGRRSSETDQAGKTTAFEYDCLGRLTKVTDAAGKETTYSYDEVGNQLTQTDANNHTTQFEYDANGRRVRRSLPLGMYETAVYDAAGNLSTRIDFNGATTTYIYDSNNRLTRRDYPDSTFVSFTYTPTGQRKTTTDFRGVTNYDYDDRDHLLSVSHPDGTAISYIYDEADNRTSVTIPSGTTTYSFDPLNRLSNVTDSDTGVTTYSYDNVGNRANVTYPNGTVATYIYDSQNRLDLLTNKRPDLTTVSSYDYIVGAAGNRTSVTEQNGRNIGYQYDDVYRLTREAILDPVNGNRTIDYTYDNVGNRLTKTDSVSGTVVYSYDDNDRLLTESGISYTYDNNGNTRTKSDGSGTTNYLHDFENRLIHADSAGNITDYQYDADGNRVQSTTNGVVTKYLVDTNRDYAQVLEERDGSGALIVSYTYGDDLIRQKRGNVISYYHYDGQMSTRQLTNGAATITDTYTFDAFGNLLASTGTTVNNYLYTGEQFDPNIGFYYFRARYYNQLTGTFMSVDPLVGNTFDPHTLHKYSYASDNPTNRIDPSGKGDFSISGLMTSISIQALLLQQQLIRAFYQGGEALGRAYQAFGALAQNTARVVIVQIPRIEFWEENFATKGRSTIDFLVRAGRIAMIEAKYALPRSGEALVRLGTQITRAQEKAEELAVQVEVLLWSLQPPSASQIEAARRSISAAGGDPQKVNFLNGIEQLYNWLKAFAER